MAWGIHPVGLLVSAVSLASWLVMQHKTP